MLQVGQATTKNEQCISDKNAACATAETAKERGLVLSERAVKTASSRTVAVEKYAKAETCAATAHAAEMSTKASIMRQGAKEKEAKAIQSQAAYKELVTKNDAATAQEQTALLGLGDTGAVNA